MCKPTTIQDILDHKDKGDAVHRVMGRVVACYPQQTKPSSQGGEFNIQNLEIRDGTNSIRVQVFDHDPIPEDRKGIAVVLQGRQKESDESWYGLRVGEYNGVKELRITEYGIISFVSEQEVKVLMQGGPLPSEEKPSDASVENQEPPPSPTSQQTRRQATPDKMTASRYLTFIAIAGRQIKVEADKLNLDWGPEECQAAAVSAAIALQRREIVNDFNLDIPNDDKGNNGEKEAEKAPDDDIPF